MKKMQNNDIQLRGSRYSALACQYLYNSSTLFTKALEKYNNAAHGEIESALSDFHKAWDALWQADKIVNENGFMTHGAPREILFLKKVDVCLSEINFADLSIPTPKHKNLKEYEKFIKNPEVEEAIRNKRLNIPPIEKTIERKTSALTEILNLLKTRDDKELVSFVPHVNTPADGCCAGYCELVASSQERNDEVMTRIWYKDPHFKLPGEPTTYSKWDEHHNRTFVEKSILPTKIPGWNSEKASDIFKEMCNYNSALRFNLKLFTLFRNSTQHDYVELAQGSYDSLVQILNPYVSALILNYLEGYEQVYSLVIKACGLKKRKHSTYCASAYLHTVPTLKNTVRLPFTFTYLTHTISSFLEPLQVPKLVENEYKTVRKIVSENIDTVHNLIHNDWLTDDEAEKIENNRRYKMNLIKEETTAVDIEDFIYPNYGKVSAAVEYITGINLGNKKVQNIAEKLFKEFPNDIIMYRRDIWGKKRYSKKLVAFISHSISGENK